MYLLQGGDLIPFLLQGGGLCCGTCCRVAIFYTVLVAGRWPMLRYLMQGVGFSYGIRCIEMVFNTVPDARWQSLLKMYSSYKNVVQSNRRFVGILSDFFNLQMLNITNSKNIRSDKLKRCFGNIKILYPLSGVLQIPFCIKSVHFCSRI